MATGGPRSQQQHPHIALHAGSRWQAGGRQRSELWRSEPLTATIGERTVGRCIRLDVRENLTPLARVCRKSAALLSQCDRHADVGLQEAADHALLARLRVDVPVNQEQISMQKQVEPAERRILSTHRRAAAFFGRHADRKPRRLR